MGFKKTYDIDIAFDHVRKAAWETKNHYATGYVAWGAKQDLYRLKWFIDEQLKNCPDFSDIEKDWLTEMEKEKIVRILKDEM